jgi:hypothetical protein
MIDTLPKVEVSGYLSVEEVAERMGTTRDYVHRLRQMGVLMPSARIDNAPLYDERDVNLYVFSHPGLGRIRAARAHAAKS